MRGAEVLKGLSTSDSPRKMQVLRHQSHSLGMDSTEQAILVEACQVALSCFLHGLHSLRCEADIGLVTPSDLAN